MSKLLKELKTAHKELQDKMTSHGKKAFVEYFREFFEKNPDIDGVRWTQYTPGFNDGDACHFGLGCVYGKLKDTDGDERDGYQYEPNEAVGELATELANMEQVLLMAFGDEKEITVTRDGVEVDDYFDHE